MSYRTQAAENLIDHLKIQEVEYRQRAERATQAYDRALWTGYADATAVYIEFAGQWLEKIETEAALVPEDEPELSTWAEAQRILDQAFPPQGGKAI